MKKEPAVRILLGLLLAVLVKTSPAEAQSKQAPITGDIVIRHEWNNDLFAEPDPVPGSRTRFQMRPKFEIDTKVLRMGLGADINYSTDDNTKPKGIPLPLMLIRDNYDSRGIRLDIAYLGLRLSSALKIDAGRMVMPFRMTDMIWDKDLRIQGASGSLTIHQGSTGEPTARVSGIYSRGSHVFIDSRDPEGSSTGEGVTITGGSLDLGLGSGKRVDLSTSYLKFEKLSNLETTIRRQNTRVAGALVREYEVIDATLRLRSDKPIPLQVILDGARNRKAPNQKNGLWATLVLGSLRDSRFRGEYTYAKVDKDVTVAAYAGDDFFWGTGWRGHRAEIAFAQSPKASFHMIAQTQQFKDSPTLLERNHWVKRFRLEARRSF